MDRLTDEQRREAEEASGPLAEHAIWQIEFRQPGVERLTALEEVTSWTIAVKKVRDHYKSFVGAELTLQLHEGENEAAGATYRITRKAIE